MRNFSSWSRDFISEITQKNQSRLTLPCNLLFYRSNLSDSYASSASGQESSPPAQNQNDSYGLIVIFDLCSSSKANLSRHLASTAQMFVVS
jgi:hypothetical protein